jgi:hyperosmotically inducible protein
MKTTRYCSLFILALFVFAFWGCSATKNPSVAIQQPGMNVSTLEHSESGRQIEDANISSAIRLKFEDDKLLSNSEINVDTSHRKVTLNGKVDTQEEADRALHLGRSVEGVRTVHSKLIVKAATKK